MQEVNFTFKTENNSSYKIRTHVLSLLSDLHCLKVKVTPKEKKKLKFMRKVCEIHCKDCDFTMIIKERKKEKSY